jgi:pimeloyl-ACP methyl ester carboxylesterase
MKTLVILIPGNPSVPGVYNPFMCQLTDDLQIPGTVHTEILHHLGQCNTTNQKLTKISLAEVIEDHKISIEKLILTHKADSVYLISHSLGSAVSISLNDYLKEKIDKFFIICPFMGPSEKNMKYLKLFQNPVSRFGLSIGSKAILANQKVARKFFVHWLGENKLNGIIINEIKKPHYIDHFFALVSGYFNDFEKLNIKDSVQNLDPGKIFFIFAKEDFWVPIEYTKLLPKASQYKILDDISHDFCLFDSQFKEVSKVISFEIDKP